MRYDFLILMAGLFGVLAVASGVGFVLRQKMGETDTIKNLNDRINAWWVMVLVMGGAFLMGELAVIMLFALCSFAALREVSALRPMAGDSGTAERMALLASLYIVLPIQYALVLIEWYGLYSIFIPVYGFLLLPILVALRGPTENFLNRVAETQWALMICVFCVSHVPALLSLRIPGYEGRNLLLIVFLIVVVQSSDVLQYIWGKLAGKTKIAPVLSPNKTLEGLVGGIGSAMCVGAALFWLTPFNVVQAAGMSLVITLMGFFGGLVMSAIKRDRGVKDWGASIAGHGGFIDRLDSVIFSAPIYFHLIRYFWSTV